MAISFKESPWYIQALVFVALAILLLADRANMCPVCPWPRRARDLQTLHEQDTKLNQEVSALQVYERRYAEFQQEMIAFNKQLDTLKTIVPEDKETDEFMRLLQGAAAASGVQIRKLTAQSRGLARLSLRHAVSIQVDGPYYGIVDFFSRLSRLSRIINVGDLKFDGLGGQARYPVRPNTTVSGTCIVTTFFTTSASAAPPPGPKRPAASPRPVN